MQSLAGYGSDSDEEHSPPVASTSTAPAPQAVPAPLLRVKGASTSRGSSPLAGVNLTSSPATHAPQPSQPTGTPFRSAGARSRSRSPPPYSAPAPVERESPAAQALGQDSQGEQQASSASAYPPGVRPDSLAEFGIPPVSLEAPSASVQAKLANFHHLAVTRGLHFNDSLSASKAFRNPRIHAKLVQFVDVVETDSNWDKAIWDPHGLPSDSSAARIAKLQHDRTEARQAAQTPGSRSSIAFASSSSRPKESSSTSKSSASSGGGKRSRWDTGGPGGRERNRSRSPRR